MKNRPLAVLSPRLGLAAGTFIFRHQNALLPGGTVVLAGSRAGAVPSAWTEEPPTLVLDEIRPARLWRQVVEAVPRRLGWLDRDPEIAVVKRFLRAHGVRVLLGEYLDFTWPWLDVARDLGIRVFGRALGYDASRQVRDPSWRGRYVRYNQTGGVITVSESLRRHLLEVGVREDIVHIVPCGVDVPATPRRREPGPVVRCLAAGRMVTKKAPILLLEAFRQAARKEPALRLDYAGDGALLAAARQFATVTGLSDRVTFHGSVPPAALTELMQQADVFVQHSIVDPDTGDEEGLPVAILEAMAQALPVVSTRHAGIPAAVRDGDTGWLVAEGDCTAMAERLIRLARAPAERQRLGEAGWQRARDRFTWDQERQSLLRLLGLATGTP